MIHIICQSINKNCVGGSVMKKTQRFLISTLIAGSAALAPLSADAFWGFPFGGWSPWDNWGDGGPWGGYPGYGYGGYPGYGYGGGYPGYGYGGYPAYAAPQAATPATE